MRKKRNKIAIVVAVVIVALAALYLNRAYARIYSNFSKMIPPEVINMTVEKKSHNIKYVALGDSLTYGAGAENTGQAWPAVLAGKMTSNQTSVELVNLAIPGAVSQDVIDAQLAEAIKVQPNMVTLFIGINDMHNFVPLDTYRANLKLILSELKNKTKAKIYIVNLPYLGTDALLLPPYNLYFDQKTDEYNKVLGEVAADFGLAPIDIHATKNLFSSDSSLYAMDEFHPSAKGYGLWANIIYDAIQ